MRHLWTAWQGIEGQIGAASHLMLFSDFDGTLCPIVARPELAALPGETGRLLHDLARHRDVTVVVISGRALSDIKGRVGIPGITCAGNHGLEIEGPRVRFVNPQAQRAVPVIRSVCRELSQALAGIEGVIVEDKGLTLSVHSRLVERGTVGKLKRLFEEVINRTCPAGQVAVTHGKKVCEVRPEIDWDKGKVVDLLTNLCGHDEPLRIFLGDDLMDEDGFMLVNQRGGLSVFVGGLTTESAASYFVDSPSEVAEFLGRLLSILAGRRPRRLSRPL